ncbi:hypothetical protein LTR78_003913 [Recurvomyces mirabilis]|uniref:Maltose/galactoside acetyltransferase domain-containing protein n=1 Tax=Recurvomyces mirabilis TaxID=574656 RepID=A0AAE0WQK0_9PEZI|nr:hypothetical protein LTR78_003913 [Recurvomyces mirabilis]KAK5153948.1 hypothetical protein LTS14_007168 [Recurvomyces mirabilis]
MPVSENKARALRGELYYAFTPELTKERTNCHRHIVEFNNAGEISRREKTTIWRNIVQDETPLPPQAATEDDDDALFAEEPWVEPPFHADYGYNIKLGQNVFLNFNTTIIDTCLVTIGARTLFGPNVSLYTGSHPLDGDLRNGTKGPESGGEIHIEEDCWIGGNAILLPGVRIGRGSTVGAGSVVTKDVGPYTVVVGNPARKLRDVPRGKYDAEAKEALAALERDEARSKTS